MFKVGRWRHEKIKVVFMLQFQATQVPGSKSKLMISLVPVDVGQPTVRLGKAAVQDGICTWENPVYETVKFTRETKTGKLHDKIYQLIISTGSSKAGFLGEVFVNLADYVEATTPSTISLPIKSSNTGAILHVMIQNMQGADDQRELQMDIEDTGASNIDEGSFQSHDRNYQSEGDMNFVAHKDDYYNTTSLDNEERNSRNGNTLNSLFEQKESRAHQETSSDQSAYTNKPVFRTPSPADNEHQTRVPITLDWSSEDDITNYVEDTNENFLREQEQEPPKSLVEQLQREIFTLKRQAEVTDIELLSLRRQAVKETKRAQELSGKVVRLKEERDAFRRGTEKIRSEQNGENGTEHPKETRTEGKKSRHRQNEVEEGLVHTKDLNRALRSQLRRTQDSNSELILVVRDLEEKLGKKETELADLTKKLKSDRTSEGFQEPKSEFELFGDREVEEAPSPNRDSKEVHLLQQLIENLQGELEDHVEENKTLQKQIKQFSKDCEIAKKDNDDLSSKFNQKQLELIKKERECTHNMRKVEELECQIARLEKVIQKQAEEFCESSDVIHDLETQVNNLKYELEKQEVEFEDELKEMTDAKDELEQRALHAEDTLRRTKLDNASAAQRLQEEFRELSEELETKFKENEDLTAKAEAEARELRLHTTTLEEHLEKANKELQLVQDQYTAEVGRLSTELKDKENKLAQLVLAHKDETVELKYSRKKVEEKCEALSNENQALRMEVERLTEDNYDFTNKIEEMKTLLDETKKSFQETKTDREELETKYTMARTEINQAQEELKVLRSSKDKEDAMAGVQLQLEKLQVQHNELKTRLSDIKLDNENLKKQVTRQKENLQKKDHEIAHLEKFKDSSSKDVSALKEKIKQLKAVRSSGISPESGSKVEDRKNSGKKSQQSATSAKSLQNGASKTSGERRDTCTEKKVTDSQASDLLTEVALLKDKNKTMEDELREMQEKYSDVSLKFAEVEGERQQLVMTIRNLRNGQKK
ncbi:MAR-binding filament-like protein 1 isoform X2 [Beta vulgaris subsp. vulgaris]|uniref:MAR-binding filament-like protein 1 isoform X2 n=1 Tax=Beta vulgaris subsp. vulgaris TaxID=3555 RepID=UPI0020372110|nr:MAR-binding filament-like protein 1 isoform X2 [Beta vulgaris subsp. vulgaris]